MKVGDAERKRSAWACLAQPDLKTGQGRIIGFTLFSNNQGSKSLNFIFRDPKNKPKKMNFFYWLSKFRVCGLGFAD